MRKPYVKKLSESSGFKVWIVDGKYIRDNIEVDFSNFGYNPWFKFIPKDELWIDKERVPGEEKYYILSMLTIIKLVENGMSHDEAVRQADEIEKAERMKGYSEEEIKDIKEKIHKKFLRKYSNKSVKVWIVDGKIVRSFLLLDFTEGGHGKVYPFIPENEVWIDNDLRLKEVKETLLHELHERRLMSEGMEYEPAHIKANELEHYCRTHSEEMDAKLKEEIEKNNGHKT